VSATPLPSWQDEARNAPVAAELAREAALRANVYPTRIRENRMTEAEARYQQAILAAMAEDWRRKVEALGDVDPPGQPRTFSNRECMAAIDREIAYRRNLYPRLVAQSRMTQAEADRRIDAFVILKAFYWEGWGWRASNGETPRSQPMGGTPAEAAAWAELRAEFTQRRSQSPEAQPSLALQ
jgi:hypothetical protein